MHVFRLGRSSRKSAKKVVRIFAHLDMCAEEKCAFDSSQVASAVRPSSIEHPRLMSQITPDRFCEAVEAFWSRRLCVPSKSSTTYFRPVIPYTLTTANMPYRPSSTILRPSSNDTSKMPSEKRRGPAVLRPLPQDSYQRICRTDISLHICGFFLGACIVMGSKTYLGQKICLAK